MFISRSLYSLTLMTGLMIGSSASAMSYFDACKTNIKKCWKPVTALTAAAAAVYVAPHVPKYAWYALGASVLGTTGLMRYRGIQASYKNNEDIIANTEEAIRSASEDMVDRSGKDKFDFIGWRFEKYSTAGDIAKNAQNIWNEFKVDFQKEYYKDFGADNKIFAKFLGEKIDTQKNKLEKLRAQLKTSLQAYNLNPKAWLEPWKVRPGIEVQWKARCGNKSYSQATDSDIRYMNAYCTDSLADFINHPGKAFKRWVLYPREGRASQAYWQLVMTIERLTALRNICTSHELSK